MLLIELLLRCPNRYMPALTSSQGHITGIISANVSGKCSTQQFFLLDIVAVAAVNAATNVSYFLNIRAPWTHTESNLIFITVICHHQSGTNGLPRGIGVYCIINAFDCHGETMFAGLILVQTGQ